MAELQKSVTVKVEIDPEKIENLRTATNKFNEAVLALEVAQRDLVKAARALEIIATRSEGNPNG